MNKKANLGISSLCCSDMAIDKDNAWFFNLPYAAIFKIDLKKKTIQLIRFLDDNQRRMFFDYSGCFVRQNNLFFMPNNSKRGICSYNVISKNISYIPFEKQNLLNSFYYMTLQVKNKLYLLGRCSKSISISIVEFDMESRKINEMSKLNEILLKRFKGINFWMEVFREGEELYIPCFNSNVILECNIKNQSVRSTQINASVKGIYTLCYFKNKYFASTTDGYVYTTNNINSDDWVILDHISGGFIRSMAIGDYLYFFPKEADGIYYLDAASDKLNKICNSLFTLKDIPNQVLKCCNYYYGNSKTLAVTPWRDRSILALMWDGNLYHIYDGKCTRFLELKFGSDRDIYQLMLCNDKSHNCYKELDHAYLPIGLDVVKSYNLELFIKELYLGETQRILKKELSGEKIYVEVNKDTPLYNFLKIK